LLVWLPAQAFSCTVPSSSPKTIKWSFLLNQFSSAAIRLPALGAAIRLPVRPPSDRSQYYLIGHQISTLHPSRSKTIPFKCKTLKKHS
jgi:hypothetical protein